MRDALRSFAIMALLLATFGAIDAGARQAQARAVTVDTSGLAKRGVPQLAARIKAALTPRARAALASAPGPAVVVRIRTLQLAAEVGGGWFRDPTDYLEGDLVIPGRAPIPILVALPASSGGAWYAPGNEGRRVAALIEAFAGWLARYANT